MTKQGTSDKAVMDRALTDARGMIKEKGFISAHVLMLDVYKLYPTLFETKAAADFVEFIANEEIHLVEYARADTADYRLKDLFYYCPANDHISGNPGG